MNRFNFGNQVTNGLQVLGVAGTTAAGIKKGLDNAAKARLGDAASALNNLSEEEIHKVGQYKADRLRDEMNNYYDNKAASVDDLMSNAPFRNLKGPQAKYINAWVDNAFDNNKYYTRDGRRFRKMTKEEFVESLKGGDDNNADV